MIIAHLIRKSGKTALTFERVESWLLFKDAIIDAGQDDADIVALVAYSADATPEELHSHDGELVYFAAFEPSL